MRSPRVYSVLLAALTALTALTAPTLYAQTGQTWSAIEVVPAKSAPVPATVAASGPAAALLPNAARPAPGFRLKGDSSPLVGVLPKLIQLRPVRFKFLPGQGEEGPQYGLLPGDLARVYPELVRTNLINGVQTVNSGQLTPLLVEAIKELNAQIVVLQGQQLQLAEAYSKLLEASQARPAAGGGSFVRRGRATDKTATGAPDTVVPNTAAPTLPGLAPRLRLSFQLYLISFFTWPPQLPRPPNGFPVTPTKKTIGCVRALSIWKAKKN